MPPVSASKAARLAKKAEKGEGKKTAASKLKNGSAASSRPDSPEPESIEAKNMSEATQKLTLQEDKDGFVLFIFFACHVFVVICTDLTFSIVSQTVSPLVC